jgi:pyridoxine 4-dehydrogenase
MMKTLKELVGEGKFAHIGLSECAAATVRRANKVCPLYFEEEAKKGGVVF